MGSLQIKHTSNSSPQAWITSAPILCVFLQLRHTKYEPGLLPPLLYIKIEPEPGSRAPLLPVRLLLELPQHPVGLEPVVLLGVVAPLLPEGPARLDLLLGPGVVVVLRELLHQRVELVRELDAEGEKEGGNKLSRSRCWKFKGRYINDGDFFFCLRMWRQQQQQRQQQY